MGFRDSIPANMFHLFYSHMEYLQSKPNKPSAWLVLAYGRICFTESLCTWQFQRLDFKWNFKCLKCFTGLHFIWIHRLVNWHFNWRSLYFSQHFTYSFTLVLTPFSRSDVSGGKSQHPSAESHTCYHGYKILLHIYKNPLHRLLSRSLPTIFNLIL